MLISAVRCSGSHTMQLSMVSPADAMSSMRRPSTVRPRRSWKVMSGVGVSWRIGTPGFSLAMRMASVPSMSNQMPAVRIRSAWMRASSAWHARLFAWAM